MRKLILLTGLAGSLWLGAIQRPLLAGDAACNPQPAPDDLCLPMPGGLTMVFRPVWLDVGDGPFAVREFLMGSRSGQDYRETPTKVQLGGSFQGDNHGMKQWLYYIGKYEVSVGQFFSVDALPDANAPPPDEGKLPVVGVDWFQVQHFLCNYNAWLFKNAKEKVPIIDGKVGFVRLPTEQEWEFAARGGTAVDTNRFDQQIPYSGDLARFEWFAGSHSSHDKLKAIGLLASNPLGIFDMLGNCSEMTFQLYQVEYTQGRAGGFVVRGGNFRTEESDLRSSLRVEQPFYGDDLQPSKSDSLGFRLVLSAPVITSIAASRKMAEAWTDYSKSRAVPMPGALNTAPVTDQTNVGLADTEKILKELETDLDQGGPALGVSRTRTDGAKAKINLLRSSFGNIQAGMVRSEKQVAEAGVLFTSQSATQIVNSLQKLALSTNYLLSSTDPEDQKREKEDQAIEQTNLKEATGRYETGLRLLTTQVRAELADDAYAAWLKELEIRKIPTQLAATQLAWKHYRKYATTQRLDMGAWVEELGALNQKQPKGTP